MNRLLESPMIRYSSSKKLHWHSTGDESAQRPAAAAYCLGASGYLRSRTWSTLNNRHGTCSTKRTCIYVKKNKQNQSYSKYNMLEVDVL